MHHKLLIASGGGGHFSPALSVIEKLPKDTEVLVVGRKHSFEGDQAFSLEYLTTKSLGIPFASITTARLQRKVTIHTIFSLLKFPVGLIQSYKIVRDYKPQLILSFGGYISIPIILVGSIMRIPVVIHEQTLGAGLSNKIASFFAKKICISFENSRKFFPANKTVLTGNPIKKLESKNSKLKDKVEKLGSRLPVIFVTGGSGGAHAINVLIEQMLEKLLDNYIVIHQTGDAKQFGDFERLQNASQNFPKDKKARYFVEKFIQPDEFGSILSISNLVVCRSGMNTITELISSATPALAIPLPFSQGDEQLHNAQFLKELGLGDFLIQKDLQPELLEEKISDMLRNESEYREHAKSAKNLLPKNAAENVLAVINEYLHEKS